MHSHSHPHPHSQDAFFAWLSVVSNTGLVAIKLAIGLLMGSVSVISEAIHSAVDVIAAIVAVVGVNRSGTPADDDHPYGHGKYDNLSGLIQAVLIFVAAGWIGWEAIRKLIHPSGLEMAGIGAVIMGFSAGVNGLVGWLLLKAGKKSGSLSLKADAWHCLTDVYTSAGVMVGLLGVWAGERWLPSMDWHWIDPTAALAVVLLIFKAAWDLTVESVRDLLDESLPAQESEAIKGILRDQKPVIKGFHNFRSRKSGNVRFVEIHILVDPGMTVGEAHSLHHSLIKKVRVHFPNTQLMLHIEPCLKNCKPECLEGCIDPPA
jgi:cation diffusion facilitator family transporter